MVGVSDADQTGSAGVVFQLMVIHRLLGSLVSDLYQILTYCVMYLRLNSLRCACSRSDACCAAGWKGKQRGRHVEPDVCDMVVPADHTECSAATVGDAVVANSSVRHLSVRADWPKPRSNVGGRHRVCGYATVTTGNTNRGTITFLAAWVERVHGVHPPDVCGRSLLCVDMARWTRPIMARPRRGGFTAASRWV